MELLKRGIQLSFFVRPFICGVIASAIWYHLFYQFDVHIVKDDEDVLLGALSFFGIWHAIVAGLIITKVWTEYVETTKAIYDQDKKKFQQLMGCRIPLVVRMFLLILSLIIQLLFSVWCYETWWSGIGITFFIALVLVMFWEVAYNLDNPLKAVWYKELVPLDWFYEDKLPQEVSDA